AEVEEDDRERAHFRDGKISLGRKKSRGSNIGDSVNTVDGGKTVGGKAKRSLDRSSEESGEVFPGEAGEIVR
ncbi:hypothetical protein Tco_1559440, partial [Tanacetum coccineum]